MFDISLYSSDGDTPPVDVAMHDVDTIALAQDGDVIHLRIDLLQGLLDAVAIMGASTPPCASTDCAKFRRSVAELAAESVLGTTP